MNKSFSYAGIGARKTPPHIIEIMTGVASNLEDMGWTLRTGGAAGADSAFFAGITDASLLELYIPWEGFQGFSTRGDPIYSINDMAPSILSEAYAIAEEHHPKWSALSDSGKKLMARNSFQVLGHDLDTPADCVICWTPNGAITGGTGQALRIAETHDIPVINLGRHSVQEAEVIISVLIEQQPPF